MAGMIYLSDGTVYRGQGFGYRGTTVGELVFNTSMTGYQEILTDPSYAGQIINMTYPLIGNYGISDEEWESEKIFAEGLIVKNVSQTPSNYKCKMTLNDWLVEMKIPGIFDVDTRSITRKIRNEGTVKCVISNEDISISEAEKLCQSKELRQDYMKSVGTKERIHIEGTGKKVAIMDFGIKKNIVESLKKRNCDIYVFPYGSTFEDIMAVNPEGVVLSNGPGDPKETTEAIEQIKRMIGVIPMLGICMGHQVLALAFGGDTYKLKYGHRGGNHGVYDKDTSKSYITSQNHGYAVLAESVILKGMDVTHINLNDGTVEGMRHNQDPVFSVQFHPEASPGPRDTAYLFERFMEMMK